MDLGGLYGTLRLAGEYRLSTMVPVKIDRLMSSAITVWGSGYYDEASYGLMMRFRRGQIDTESQYNSNGCEPNHKA